MKLALTLFVVAILLCFDRNAATSPAPSRKPSKAPSASPTITPTRNPTTKPSFPSFAPTTRPTRPTNAPTRPPTRFPSTSKPTNPTVQPTASTPTPTTPLPGVLVSFSFTGYPQNFTVPTGVTELTVTLIGASGARARGSGTNKAMGGRGARITAIVPVNPGDVYQIRCGGEGGIGGVKVAGYNGGGAGKGLHFSTFVFTAAGGGGTDFRAYPYTIDDRMMVGGGGGGAGGNCELNTGGDAGWPIGLEGARCTSTSKEPLPTGGTQDSGGFAGGDDPGFNHPAYEDATNRGSFFYGGEAVDDTTSTKYGYGGGGGGGYFGGGGGYIAGGGGGSSYSNYPIVEASNGTWTGNGSAWITYVVGVTNPTSAPTVLPTAPSNAPSAGPSHAPSMHPSAGPSAIPSATPSQDPTAGPTYTVTAPIPTAPPSIAPSADPSAGPSVDPSALPSVSPSAVPSILPSADPSAIPSVAPTVPPTQPIPTEIPTLAPSANPSVAPSTDPSVAPSLVPTTNPSVSPSANPSVAPSLVPTTNPSVSPSANPSVAPSVVPTTNPSVAPSLSPLVVPTVVPTIFPSVSPSADPSADPTLLPTVSPTVAPSLVPTADPSLAPSTEPTRAPTLAPTAAPTARPTLQTVKPYEVVLGVEQDVYFMTIEAYQTQQVQCNLTIQHTVAASMDGVMPERVTEIEVKEASGAKGGNMRALATTGIPLPVLLKYKVTVYDPVLSADVLAQQLIAKVQSGDMDIAFRAFAVVFNATRLENGTFTEPRISVLNKVNHEDAITGGELAGVVIGGFVFVVLLTFGVWLFVICLRRRDDKTDQQEQSDPTESVACV